MSFQLLKETFSCLLCRGAGATAGCCGVSASGSGPS